ncbi:MAG: 50S ribosome-binding GTPase [Candidatus Shikimatogenerans bostrichidophilus]|nr:MAG: 50S ribosome-binding GTPase [Candidatus Shikimatogenerans bostrichidophilus]
MKFKNIISIIGLTNVGKSYIYNKILGKLKSFIHPKNNFTIDLIYNIFYINNIKNLIIDTPGFINNKSTIYSIYLIKKLYNIIEYSNIIIYVTKNYRDINDNIFLTKIKYNFFKKKKILIILNKENKKINNIYLKYFNINEIIIINKSKNIRKTILKKLILLLNTNKEYNYYFYKYNNYYIRYLVRNLIFTEFYKEIPYSIFIYNIKIINYNIIIYLAVEKDSQKRIILGYNLNRINKIKNNILKNISNKYKISNIILKIKILKWKNNKYFLNKYYL